MADIVVDRARRWQRNRGQREKEGNQGPSEPRDDLRPLETMRRRPTKGATEASFSPRTTANLAPTLANFAVVPTPSPRVVDFPFPSSRFARRLDRIEAEAEVEKLSRREPQPVRRTVPPRTVQHRFLDITERKRIAESNRDHGYPPRDEF